MTQEEFDKVLERHQHWLKEDCKGWENMQANLHFQDLSNLKLSSVNLRGAILYNTDLHNVSLRNADLSYTYLDNANLQGADLSNANLCLARLNSANLNNANMCHTDLHMANLKGATLCNASMCDANLYFAFLSFADLKNTNLHRTNLYCANLNEAENIPFIPLACPSEGAFIGWKKRDCYLIKLKIPASAKRSSATTEKCRCSKAKVLGIYNLDGTKANIISIKNTDYAYCEYVVGEMVYPDSFDTNRWNEYSSGIHFFVHKEQALNY